MNALLTLIKAVAALALVPCLILLLATVGAAIGALSALGAAFWFPETAAKLHVLTGFYAYQLGAVFGFVAALIRPVSFNKE